MSQQPEMRKGKEFVNTSHGVATLMYVVQAGAWKDLEDRDETSSTDARKPNNA
jgi:hypothetical protein